MRILQIIDSLEPGGAERMAVNYANVLSEQIAFSGLVATRKEGALKSQLNKKVSYLFLNKKKAVDLKALLNLRKFIKDNRIVIVHAHGTSFFLAILLKFITPSIKVIWHDHNGDRSNQKKNENKTLRFCSFFFDGILVVNTELERWAKKNLFARKVLYVSNFTIIDFNESQQTLLKGEQGKRIVCLSNLRHPKNHLTLANAFANSGLIKNGWTLHFIGKDYKDEYAETLKKCIFEYSAEESIFIYGSRPDIFLILKQADIGILGSYYEGFPVSLIEYGLSGLAVITTNVGYCKEIVCHDKNGILFDPKDVLDLQKNFVSLCKDSKKRERFGQQLQKDVEENYSASIVINTIIKYYQSL